MRGGGGGGEGKCPCTQMTGSAGMCFGGLQQPRPPPPPPPPPPALSAHSTMITMRIIAVRCRARLPAVSHTSELRVQGWAPYKQMHPRAGVGTVQGSARSCTRSTRARVCTINATCSCTPFDLCVHHIEQLTTSAAPAKRALNQHGGPRHHA